MWPCRRLYICVYTFHTMCSKHFIRLVSLSVSYILLRKMQSFTIYLLTAHSHTLFSISNNWKWNVLYVNHKITLYLLGDTQNLVFQCVKMLTSYMNIKSNCHMVKQRVGRFVLHGSINHNENTNSKNKIIF